MVGCADQRHKKKKFLEKLGFKESFEKDKKEASGNGDTSQMVTRVEEDWKVQTGAAQLLKKLDDNLARPPKFPLSGDLAPRSSSFTRPLTGRSQCSEVLGQLQNFVIGRPLKRVRPSVNTNRLMTYFFRTAPLAEWSACHIQYASRLVCCGCAPHPSSMHSLNTRSRAAKRSPHRLFCRGFWEQLTSVRERPKIRRLVPSFDIANT